MTLTIITVASQDSGRLKKTLQSVVGIPPDVEHISVIPSTDQESLNTWNEFRTSVGTNFRLTNDLGVGVYEAMNVGIASASKEYICFWNAGDELQELNGSLQQTLRFLTDEKPGWLLVNGIFNWRENYAPSERELRNFILHRNRGFVSHQTTIVSKQFFHKIGCFNSKFRIAADTAVITQLAQLASPSILNVQLVRVEKPNFAAVNNRRSRLESLLIAIMFLRGGSRIEAVINIIRGELQVFIRKILGSKFKRYLYNWK